MSETLRICGIDPGFANLGFCIVDVLPIGGLDLIDTKLVTTAPSKKKITQGEDEKQRLEEIEDAFTSFLDEHNPELVAIEDPGKCLMKRKTG